MKRLKALVKNDIWILILDIIAVNASYFLALIIRYYINYTFIFSSRTFLDVMYKFAPWYTIICLVVFFACRLYGGLWRYAGIKDMNRIVLANIITCIVQVVCTLLFYQRMPMTYYVGGAAFQFIFVVIIRFAYRIIVVEKKARKNAFPTMVIGTGDVGMHTIRLLDAGVSYRPACVIDSTNKHVGKTLDGIPVYGEEQIEDALERHDINCVFLADPELAEKNRDRIITVCKYKNIEFKDYSSFFAFTGESDSFTGMQDVVSGPEGQKRIPFSPPDISDSEINEVVEALKSGWITTGPRTKLLERRLAAFIETGKTDVDTEAEASRWSNRVVCLNSATAAEELNLRVFGIREGDEVIVPAYTYTASASAAIHCGATIRFVDIQKDGDPITK